jgi:hypothetical protein
VTAYTAAGALLGCPLVPPPPPVGRIAALYCRSPAAHQIRLHIRRLYF